MGKLESIGTTRKGRSGPGTGAPAPAAAGDLPAHDSVPPSTGVELLEASWVGSTWDLLSGLDVVESEPGTLFDEFFDSASGAALESAQSDGLSKDQWVLAFAVELAELDRQREPTDVIRLAQVLWRKKQHLRPEAVARDVYSTGWTPRRARERDVPDRIG